MNARKMIIGAALAVVGLPVVLVLMGAVSFYVLNRTNGTIVSSGEKREYLLYVPPGYDRSKPTPLVISMHAAALWPAHQMNLSRWNRLADEHGFIVVYPSGSEVPRVWHVDRGAGLMRDVRYTNCAQDAAVVLYTVQGGGHSWPGGKPLPEWMVGSTSSAISATSELWAFFNQHPLARK